MPRAEISRLSRLTAILTQLQAKRLVKAPELAKKFGVSVRTIYRDMRALEAAGVPIFTEEGIGYGIMAEFRLPPVMFTEEEANALVTAEHLIRSNKDASLVNAFADAIEKLKSVMREGEKEKSDLLADRMIVRENHALEKTSDCLAVLQLAITNSKLVRVEYLAAETTQATNRLVEPFAIFNTQANWILIAWCRLRDDFRAFRLDRIEGYHMLSEAFEPQDLTLQEYFEICRQKIISNP